MKKNITKDKADDRRMTPLRDYIFVTLQRRTCPTSWDTGE